MTRRNTIYAYNNIVTRAGYLMVCWGALILCLLCAWIVTGIDTLRAKLRGLS